MTISEFMKCLPVQPSSDQAFKICAELYLPKTFLYLIFICTIPTDNINQLGWFYNQTHLQMSTNEPHQFFQHRVDTGLQYSPRSEPKWDKCSRVSECDFHTLIPLDVISNTNPLPFYANEHFVSQLDLLVPKASLSFMKDFGQSNAKGSFVVLDSTTQDSSYYWIPEKHTQYQSKQYMVATQNSTSNKNFTMAVQIRAKMEARKRQEENGVLLSTLYDIFTPIMLFTEVHFKYWDFKLYQTYRKIFETEQIFMDYNRFTVRSNWTEYGGVFLHFDVHDSRVQEHPDFVRIWLLHMLRALEPSKPPFIQIKVVNDNKRHIHYVFRPGTVYGTNLNMLDNPTYTYRYSYIIYVIIFICTFVVNYARHYIKTY